MCNMNVMTQMKVEVPLLTGIELLLGGKEEVGVGEVEMINSYATLNCWRGWHLATTTRPTSSMVIDNYWGRWRERIQMIFAELSMTISDFTCLCRLSTTFFEFLTIIDCDNTFRYLVQLQNHNDTWGAGLEVSEVFDACDNLEWSQLFDVMWSWWLLQ